MEQRRPVFRQETPKNTTGHSGKFGNNRVKENSIGKITIQQSVATLFCEVVTFASCFELKTTLQIYAPCSHAESLRLFLCWPLLSRLSLVVGWVLDGMLFFFFFFFFFVDKFPLERTVTFEFPTERRVFRTNGEPSWLLRNSC